MKFQLKKTIKIVCAYGLRKLTKTIDDHYPETYMATEHSYELH